MNNFQQLTALANPVVIILTFKQLNVITLSISMHMRRKPVSSITIQLQHTGFEYHDHLRVSLPLNLHS